MVEKARTLIQSFGFTAYESHCALEAKPPVQWNKGIKQSWRRAIEKKNIPAVRFSLDLDHFDRSHN
jgi:hypothetical protein